MKVYEYLKDRQMALDLKTQAEAADEIPNGVTMLDMDSPGEEQGHGKRGKRK